MTELGMVLSNSLKGVRRVGSVGHPLPFVVRYHIVDNFIALLYCAVI